MKLFQTLGITSVVVLALMGSSSAQSPWKAVNPPGACVGAMLQLRDGRILVHQEPNGNGTCVGDLNKWLILQPDASGDYANGMWSPGGNMQPGYVPLFFGSQVLLNGTQVVIEGGEYNTGDPRCPGQTAEWTARGAIGTVTPFMGPLAWAANAPPAFFGGQCIRNPRTIGDAQSVILANGNYMQANALTDQNAIFNGPNAWIATGPVLQLNNDEAAFTLLTNNLVLTVDTSNSACNGGTSKGSELYDQGTGVWSCGPETMVKLYTTSRELGAAIMMYNNKVLQFGGDVVATAIYDVTGNSWAAGPTPPNNLDQSDGPAALEPNGKVLAMLSQGQTKGCQFLEYDPGTNMLSNAANPMPSCTGAGSGTGDTSYFGKLMILPNGQIMFTDFSDLVQVYTPAAGVVAGVAPTILLPSTFLTSGSMNNLLYGFQLNGLTQNNGYGNDYQGDTDFPLVRLKSVANGKVVYAFTHDDSTHSIAPHTFGFTKFDLPTLPPGLYDLVAVTNGIASNSIRVTVR